MHKTLTTIFASMATSMLLTATPASATVYKFTFESFDSELMATGTMTVDAADEVTAISGAISGLANQTIGSVTPNSNFSGPAYSPDSLFIYNNVFYTSGMAFDVYGVLFETAQNPGGYWNLWGSSPGDYSLWESTRSNLHLGFSRRGRDDSLCSGSSDSEHGEWSSDMSFRSGSGSV